MRDTPWILLVLAALVLAAACGGAPESEGTADIEGAESGVEGDVVDETREPAFVAGAQLSERAGPTAEWTGQRAIQAIDSVFPHSPHYEVACQRCHSRPASHVTHTDAECTACHHRPEILATLPRRNARECATCHHEQYASRACTSCHDRDAVGPRPVLLAIETAGRADVRVHSVTFSHSLHADRACRQCHTEAVTRQFGGDCSICHLDHHRPAAECTTCHEASGLAVHASRDVHQSCAGGGCHQDATVLGLRPTRNICLTCHTDMRDHRPGQECVGCHAIAQARLGGNQGGDR